MADRFIAINVGTGDAFFLEREGFTTLVDGGQDTGFPRRFVRTTGRDGVDVLVCTHNDCDHANGIVEFIDDGLSAREVWLPATWLEALADMLKRPDYVFDVLLPDEGVELDAPSGEDGDGDDERAAPRPKRAGSEVNAAEVDGLLEQAADQDPRWDGLAQPWPSVPYVIVQSGHRVVVRAFPGAAAATGVNLLLAATNIRKIAVAATRKRIRIRWFDPEHAPQTAAPAGPLQVVNATEVRAIRRTMLAPRDVLRLTQINRDSLVLHSPASATAPGVFFSADSGLDFIGPLPGGGEMIVTAPHHGSNDRENVAAYGRLRTKHGPIVAATWTWVRSDKRLVSGKSRPTAEYLKTSRRFCTNCRGTMQSQDVVLIGGGGAWSPDTTVKPCACTTP